MGGKFSYGVSAAAAGLERGPWIGHDCDILSVP